MTLPNFLIIGASKTATTSLYHYLDQHPDVYMSPVKEPAYYALSAEVRPVRTRAAYERLFDGATTERAIGEASTQYLNDRDAPTLVAADLPGARILVSLRNPADRAYSSYLGRLAAGTEQRGVDEALQVGTYYFESSLYFEPLSRWLDHFGRERVKVVLYDDMARDARATVRDVCTFLGIDPSFDFDANARHGSAAAPRSVRANAAFMRMVSTLRRVVPIRNSGLAARAHRLFLRQPPRLPDPIRRRLLAAFANDLRRTEELIGRSLSHWLE